MAGSVSALASASAAAETAGAAGGAAAAAAAALPWPLNTPVAAALMRWGVPLGGPAVGLLTACTAGYLYPMAARLLWPSDLQVPFFFVPGKGGCS